MSPRLKGYLHGRNMKRSVLSGGFVLVPCSLSMCLLFTYHGVPVPVKSTNRRHRHELIPEPTQKKVSCLGFSVSVLHVYINYVFFSLSSPYFSSLLSSSSPFHTHCCCCCYQPRCTPPLILPCQWQRSAASDPHCTNQHSTNRAAVFRWRWLF